MLYTFKNKQGNLSVLNPFIPLFSGTKFAARTFCFQQTFTIADKRAYLFLTLNQARTNFVQKSQEIQYLNVPS